MNKFLIIMFSILSIFCKNRNESKTPTNDEIEIKQPLLSDSIEMIPKLEASLNEIKNNFQPQNKGFLMNISSKNVVILQVVHTSYIEELNKPKDSFGVAISITFDPSNLQGIAYNQKFKNLAVSDEFTSYE